MAAFGRVAPKTAVKLVPWLFPACLIMGCLIVPYSPKGGKLLNNDRGSEYRTRLFEAPDAFYVVKTWQGVDPRNAVCVFDTKEAAEEFYRDSVRGVEPYLCGIEPYQPDGGTLVKEVTRDAHTVRIVAAVDGFYVIDTRPMFSCPCGDKGKTHAGGFYDVKAIERDRMDANHVCVFDSLEEAERYHEKVLKSLPLGCGAAPCPCGESGRAHSGRS